MSQIKKPNVQILGQPDYQGVENSHKIIALVMGAMSVVGYTEQQISEYVADATSSDYDHLLKATMERVNIV